MIPFLKTVADDIYKRFNGDLADIAVVFPNKRASLFFNEYLLQNSKKPLWSPIYITISELFEQQSNLMKGDSILLVSKLYKAYCKHTKSTESIDKFYQWGELLIKDFDDIDKNLVDASSIFANLHDLRNIGNAAETLDEEQRNAIEQFFHNFRPQERSELKERFLRIWEVMGDIYETFRNELFANGIAYEGMLYRDIIEQRELPSFPLQKYIFVGFNALNRVESRLFDIMKERGQALFYWDYDDSYTDDKEHEAGRFMRRNLQLYPNALENAQTSLFKNPKEIEIISTNTDSIQTRFASNWIEQNLTEKEVETAVILCDETKLEPVLHVIPPKVNNINVTMGFPLSHTPVYNLVRLLTDLQTNGYDVSRATFTLDAAYNILNHPYVQRNSKNAAHIAKEIIERRLFFPPMEMLQADEFLARIFTRHCDNALWISSIGDIIFHIAQSIGRDKENTPPDLYEELFREAMLKVFTQTQRFMALIESGDLNMQQRNIGRLLMQVLSSESMPFHGEPVVGMQVMGLLETRNLDFRNIIMLSANEGNLPKNSGNSSYIPYNLRRAFGLTLNEHRDSIYAYNFYRLIQRAEKITLLYNSATDSANKGECSRYILQLEAAYADNIKKISIENILKNSTHELLPVAKDKNMIEHLQRCYNCNCNSKARTLSPSAINRYLNCQLSFFYRYIMELSVPDEVTASIQSRDFGNIFHKSAELFYKKLTAESNGTIEKNDLEPYIKNDALLYDITDRAFNEVFFKNNDEKPIYDGEQYINREVLHHFLKRLIKMDAEHAPFKYVGAEKNLIFELTLPTANNVSDVKLRIGGRADRIDLKNDTLEIIDYKTGGKEEIPENLADVFAHKGKNMGYIFQALLYSVAALEKNMAHKVSPSLIYIHKKSSPKRSDFVIKMAKEPLTDVSPIRNDFLSMLTEKLSEIFDVTKPFYPTEEIERCQWCDFKNICRR